MNRPKNNERSIEDQLADFTDHILDEKKPMEDGTPFGSSPELRALEQTALRLKNAFQEDGPSEAVTQRMRKNIVAQWQQQKIKESEPFWKKWMPSGQKWESQHNRRRWGMAISLAVLAVLMLISAPLLKGIAPGQPATSWHNLDPSALVVFGGLILVAFWLIRRKR